MNKKTVGGLIVGLILVFSASGANAQIMEIFGELPLSYSLSSGDSASSVSGSLVGVRSAFIPAGIALEKYSFTTGSGSSVDVQLTNIFYSSAFPLFQLAVGVGLGGGTTTGYNKATLTQYYFNAGYPIIPMFSVFAGYHVVSGSGTSKVTGDPILDLSGKLLSLGVRFGF